MMTATSAKREYSGAALNGFIVGLADHQPIIARLLADAGVERIDPSAWYDLDWAFDLFAKIEELLGHAAIIEVGRAMVETANFPAHIDSVKQALASLGEWWRLNARGPDLGTFNCEWEDEHTAVIESTVYRTRCALTTGIIEGACMKFGVAPLVEHDPGSCVRDPHDLKCVYVVSW